MYEANDWGVDGDVDELWPGTGGAGGLLAGEGAEGVWLDVGCWAWVGWVGEGFGGVVSD